ncbi:MAG: NUDIX hydrolase [Gammaproteobacteria bacterium]|nr:NUDIX hydrolase [Gammaproteobacteria bacterium]MDE0410679.1 NUDIX hydrolase [Gammaproteobacteria bacterium]
MNFCSNCGSSAIRLTVPPGDNRPRFVCASCNEIFYHNPKIVAGCIAEWQDKILMCKRAIEPRYGMWTFPAGFMENEETVSEAAARETYEEAIAKVTGLTLYSLYSLPHINQVYVVYRAVLVEGRASPGAESLEVALMGEKDVPWQDIAFPVIRESLEQYFEDKQKNRFSLHHGDMRRQAGHDYEIIRY